MNTMTRTNFQANRFCDYCQIYGHVMEQCSNDDLIRFYHLCTIKLRAFNRSILLFNNWLNSFYDFDSSTRPRSGSRSQIDYDNDYDTHVYQFNDNKQIMLCFSVRFCNGYIHENQSELVIHRILNYMLFNQRYSQHLIATQASQTTVDNNSNISPLDEQYYINYIIPPASSSVPFYMIPNENYEGDTLIGTSVETIFDLSREIKPTIQITVDTDIINANGTFDCPICFDNCIHSVQVKLQCDHTFCVPCQIGCFEKQMYNCSMCRTSIEKMTVLNKQMQELLVPYC